MHNFLSLLHLMTLLLYNLCYIRDSQWNDAKLSFSNRSIKFGKNCFSPPECFGLACLFVGENNIKTKAA